MRRLERAGLTATVAATATGLIFLGACAEQVTGTPEVNQADLAAYASEVTSSSVAASSSRAAAAARAAESACETFGTANESSVDTFNAYIDAGNNNAPDVEAKANAAVETLRANAQEVDEAITRDLPSDLSDKLTAYRDDTNALADTLEQRADVDTLNAAIDTFNDTKDALREACRAY
ncbi:hypothetical protein IU433_09445 [Nocardia puris]|uniref:Uncharacterized protein n=1 Tax=Nocardia puris TaxID=208602 RepID=A0A366DSA7_9NOCA|nr:hypothetical protein [Nocardia puris]MBF6210736.1 hypothetical protein [Nocardia puris]MBF6364332.1 hypothetical protein [Nocardia puris]MBF6459261.1 hypothetical protein [Nocardia puris]RBO92785.1 hypothetical protein DFR74_103431 [Nocardia puris]